MATTDPQRPSPAPSPACPEGAAAPAPGSAVLEIYPGPGVETYRSDLYTVEVHDGAGWQAVYLYKVARLCICYGWRRGEHPSVSFATFGTSGAVRVRVTKLSGGIGRVEISPRSKAIAAAIEDGRAVFTLTPLDKAWVTVDGDDANPVFLFADAPKPPVPEGAEYFGPGVHTLGLGHRAQSGRAIYLDGGAWVRGTFDLAGQRDVRILGPGVLSGELWPGESLEGLSSQEKRPYLMVAGGPGGAGPTGNRLEGVTIVNTPWYCTFYGLQEIYGVKLISPWYGSTDGFYLSPNPQQTAFVDQCFAFVGDDVFFTRDNFRGNMAIRNSFVSSSNNNIFCMSYWANSLDHDFTAVAENIDIKVCPEHAVFQCVIDGTASDTGVKNHRYEDIRIEGDLNANCRLVWIENRPYPWPEGKRNLCNGNTRNLRFRNITVEGRQNLDCRKSRIIGKDAENGHRDIVFENLTIDGVPVTDVNAEEYFELNDCVYDLQFRPGRAEG